MRSPKKPKKTAEEKALEIRQQKKLDEEIEESESRFRMFSRRMLGPNSLLSGAPRTTAELTSGRPPTANISKKPVKNSLISDVRGGSRRV